MSVTKPLYPPTCVQVHELEGSSRSVSVQSLEELAAVRRENEELKEVLSEVQLDLEANAQEGDRKSRELILVRDQLGDAKSRLQVSGGRSMNFGGFPLAVIIHVWC